MNVSLRAIARALLVSAVLSVPVVTMAPGLASAQVGISISVNVEPPALPIYEQPPIPAEGYIWTPGYWAWDAADNDYYWAPGAWIQPPRVGLLWTPGYWGWNDGSYVFNEGYWGTNVGFYGGIDYGYGYAPNGYYGGRWENGRFDYNRSVTNITNVNITNVYDAKVPASQSENHASFNGGKGGTSARPTAEQQAAAKDHVQPTAQQIAQANAAKADPQEHFKANHGRPAVAATAKAGDLKSPGAVPAKEVAAPAASSGENASTAKPEAKPAEAKAPEAKPMESRTPDAKAAEKKMPENKPAEARAPEAKPMERKTPEAKAVEQKAPEAKPTESRAATERPEPKAEAPRTGDAPRMAEPAPRAMDAPAVHANAAPQHAAPEGGKPANCGKPKCD